MKILSKYLESADESTKGHSTRVSELAMKVAIARDLHHTDVENFGIAVVLHGIGKIEISGEMLRQAANLTTEEREQINQHAERGARILSSVGSVLKEVVPIVMAHHEYFSSKDNKKDRNWMEAETPLGARILAVADSFDAITTDRPYRNVPQGHAALAGPRRNRSQFCQAV